ncbi:MAG: TonB-dependent receptor [Sphingopyxis sp.]|nr:TonB-dependent receptor [Sphingopyxis sp.]
MGRRSRRGSRARRKRSPGRASVFYKTEGYVTAALRVDYNLTDRITIGVGGRNLFDRNYALTDGFPEPGRSLFLGVRARY